MALGNGLTASRTRSITTSISNGRFVLTRIGLSAIVRDGLERAQAFLVDPAHDAFNVGLLDRQVLQAVAGSHLGDQLGGGSVQAVELQPSTRTVGAHLLGPRYAQRTRYVVGQVDHQRAFGAEPIANAIQRAVVA